MSKYFSRFYKISPFFLIIALIFPEAGFARFGSASSGEDVEVPGAPHGRRLLKSMGDLPDFVFEIPGENDVFGPEVPQKVRFLVDQHLSFPGEDDFSETAEFWLTNPFVEEDDAPMFAGKSVATTHAQNEGGNSPLTRRKGIRRKRLPAQQPEEALPDAAEETHYATLKFPIRRLSQEQLDLAILQPRVRKLSESQEAEAVIYAELLFEKAPRRPISPIQEERVDSAGPAHLREGMLGKTDLERLILTQVLKNARAVDQHVPEDIKLTMRDRTLEQKGRLQAISKRLRSAIGEDEEAFYKELLVLQFNVARTTFLIEQAQAVADEEVVSPLSVEAPDVFEAEVSLAERMRITAERMSAEGLREQLLTLASKLPVSLLREPCQARIEAFLFAIEERLDADEHLSVADWIKLQSEVVALELAVFGAALRS